MATYAYIWRPKSQALAQNWWQGPGTLAHLDPPPVLGQGLALGPPYVSIYYRHVSTCVHMCPYVSTCIHMYPMPRVLCPVSSVLCPVSLVPCPMSRVPRPVEWGSSSFTGVGPSVYKSKLLETLDDFMKHITCDVFQYGPRCDGSGVSGQIYKHLSTFSNPNLFFNDLSIGITRQICVSKNV